MAIVCNNIVPSLVVTLPSSCAQFSETQAYASACGSGTATDSCNLSITGGQPPYNTTFSYSISPTPTNCTLNMAAFTGGSGATPQFGYGFTSSNMCNLSINGGLRVHYTVTDAAGQTVSGVGDFNVSIRRYIQGSGGGGCVAVNSFVTANKLAGDVVESDVIFGMTDTLDFMPMTVVSNRPEYQDTVRITMKTGASLVISKTTPVTLKDGSMLWVTSLTPGIELPVQYGDDGIPFWDEIESIEETGQQEVALISVGGHSYAAGETPEAYIYTHNMAIIKQ